MHLHGNMYASHYEVFLVLRPEANTSVSVFLLIQSRVGWNFERGFLPGSRHQAVMFVEWCEENIQNSPEMLASLTSGGKCMWTTSHTLPHTKRTLYTIILT